MKFSEREMLEMPPEKTPEEKAELDAAVRRLKEKRKLKA